MNATDISMAQVQLAARRPEVVAAMRNFYAQAAERIAAQSPLCWNKGECCQFGRYGHRLYVTALETAYYLATRTEAQAAPLSADAGSSTVQSLNTAGSLFPMVNPPRTAIEIAREDTCPHAFEGRCHVRDRRPLGCRIFYCDPDAQHWQGPLTEELLSRLRDMHEELHVPYFYADWMTVLRAIGAYAENGEGR